MSEDRNIEYRAINDSDLGRILWPLLLTCLLLVLWLIYWPSRGSLNGGSTAEVEMTPISESAAISAESNGSTDGMAAVNDSGSNGGLSSGGLFDGMGLNSTLIVAEAAAEARDGGLRLYTTASFSSETREIYRPGERFTLVEPNEGFEVYPVKVEGVSWVRVRDSDGLLGWADMSLLVSE